MASNTITSPLKSLLHSPRLGRTIRNATLGNHRYSLYGDLRREDPLLHSLSLPTIFLPHPPKTLFPKEPLSLFG